MTDRVGGSSSPLVTTCRPIVPRKRRNRWKGAVTFPTVAQRMDRKKKGRGRENEEV